MVGGDLSVGYTTVSASNSGVTVPSGASMVVITAGSASADFALTLPASPTSGQLLFIRNLAPYAATYSDGTGSNSSDVALGGGALYAGSPAGAAGWIKVF